MADLTSDELSSSGEEVKSKPGTPFADTEPAADSGTAADNYHYDILVLGRTGMGKSSTVDKLMVPNAQYSSKRSLSRSGGGTSIGCYEQSVMQGSQEEASPFEDSTGEWNGDNHRVNAQYENLTILVLSDKRQEHENSIHRIKNIAFCRSLHNSHIEIDRLRNNDEEEVYNSSQSCQLLMNDESKIRTLDMPGFYSPQHVYGATNPIDSNLAIVRHVVRIQAIAGLKFRRILYFLPQSGPLKRADRTLQEELQQMVKFFGRSIFKRMVLVGTAAVHTSEDSSLSPERKFPKRSLDQSKTFFQEALERVFEERQEDTQRLPRPPIIFISMTDSCEEILEKVMTAPVRSNEGLELIFNSNTCSRCSIEVAMRNKDLLTCEYRVQGDNPWANSIPYNESKCHPMMTPRVTARAFALGILGLFRFKWRFTEERCVNTACKKGPGTRGCMKVQTVYEEDGFEPIVVDHTDEIDRSRERR